MSLPGGSFEGPVLLPLGQPLGLVFDPAGSFYHVRLGSERFLLEPAEAAVWLSLHAVRPGTSVGLDRALVASLGIHGGAVDPGRALQVLLDLGLVAEVQFGDRAAMEEFVRQVRLAPLQPCIGHSVDSMNEFVLVAGDRQTVVIDNAMRVVLAPVPHWGNLGSRLVVHSGAMSVAPETAELGDPWRMTEHVLNTVQPVLSVHGAYFDRAIDIRAHADHLDREGLRHDPESVRVTGDTDPGLFGLGHLAGVFSDEVGILCVDVQLKHHASTLLTEEAMLGWIAARGTPDDPPRGDRESVEAYLTSLGVEDPQESLAEVAEEGLLAEPGIEGLARFAAQYRLEPLLAGVCNSVEEPERFQLGVNDDLVVAQLNAQQYEVWRDAPLSESLLDAAHAAGKAQTAGDLAEYLETVRFLTSRNAAFISLLRQP